MIRKILVFAVTGWSAAAAQTRTCTPVGTSVVCTDAKPASTVGAAADGLAGVLQGLAIDKANADAKAAMDAQVQLFVDRAVMVIRQGKDSLRFSPTDRAAKLDSLYWNDATQSVGLLYRANPAASTQQIREAVEPVVDKYRRLKRP